MARELANSAADAYDAGDFARALEHVTRANELFPAPSLTLLRARSLFALGRWVEAVEQYAQTARAQLGPEAPAAFQFAVNQAATEGNQLEARLPRIELHVAKRHEQTVLVDGREIASALLGIAFPIDPGQHQVSARAQGETYFETTTDAVEGKTSMVNIPPPDGAATLVAEQPPAPLPATPPPSDRPIPTRTKRTNWPAIAAFTGAAVTAGVAVPTLLIALNRKNRLDEACDPGCPDNFTPTLNEYHQNRTLFLVSAPLSLVAAGLGSYFTIWPPQGSKDVALVVHPTGVLLRGKL